MTVRVLFSVVLLGCQPSSGEFIRGQGSGSTAKPVDSDSVVLERGPCYGSCPQYRVRIKEGGGVAYTGFANVAHVGSTTGTIAASSASALIGQVEASAIFGLPDSIVVGSAACGPATLDLPRVTLTIGRQGRVKHIVQDYGCSAAPRILRQLHARIDSVSGSSKWTGNP